MGWEGVAVTATILELVAVCDGDDESVTVSATVNDLVVKNVWRIEAPVPVEPSPKFQVIV